MCLCTCVLLLAAFVSPHQRLRYDLAYDVCVSVCPAFTAYISLIMGRILIKLGGNVETLVQLIVLKFHKNLLSVDVIMTSFLFFKSYF